MWIHAASVGEVVSVIPVLDELKRLLPKSIIVMTTITQTGNAMARKSAKSADAIGYFPLDYPVFASRALDRIEPDVFVMVEVELWPNFLAAARRKGVPCVLINGRVSDRSLHRLKWWGWVMSWATSNLDYCLMQTATDAERIQLMGVKGESVSVVGSTKFDEGCGRLTESDVQDLRSSMGLPSDSRVFVAGSTNPGEDRVVLDAFVKMRAKYPDLKMIIAPRQLDRSGAICDLVKSSGFSCVLRTEAKSADNTFDVLVLNSYGELARVYAVGDIAFVGGSLIPKGGHSLIQPIIQGKPVLFGPHTFKTKDVAHTALLAGVGFEVHDAKELAGRSIELLSDTNRLVEIADSCTKLVEANQGASVRCAELVSNVALRHRESRSAN